MKKNKLLYLFSLLLLGMFYCCTDDRERYDTPVFGKEKMVTFSVRVPGAPKTYALTEGEENEVRSIAILLFDNTSGNYEYQPIYSNDITTDPGDSRNKTFTVKVPEGTYDMVLLANANTSLGTALGGIAVGDAKAAVLDKLKQNNAGKWDTNSASGSYIPIPMWGEIQGIAVSSSMPANVPVQMVRMLAKIDVALMAAAKGKFSLESVRLYNYNDQGYIAPDVSTWNYATNIATAPFVPATASKPATPATSPLIYDGAAITPDPAAPGRGLSCLNEIYTFEAAMGSDATLLDNTCLVVGGTYTGDGQPTYYRIDLANTSGSTATYLPVLRNHNYKVNIADVTGTGFNNPEDAFKSRPVNIQASIINWNDATITDVVFDGQYMLGVSQGEFTFSREARTASDDDNILSVTTDYPSGWTVEKIIDDADNPVSWVSVNPNSGATGVVTDTRLEIDENNDAAARTAYIHLSAGRLTYIVKVEQTALANIGISVRDAANNAISVMEFVSTLQEVNAGTAPASQQFKLSWAPATSDLFYTSTTTSNLFDFSGAGDIIPANGSLSDPTGTQTYTVAPNVITPADIASDPFYERSSIYLYTVSNGVANATKSLILKQYAYNMVPVVESVYLMDGTQKSFGVRSNSPFTVDIKTNPNNVVSNVSTSGNPSTSASGTPVFFDVVDDLTSPSIFQEDIVLTIKSPTGLFPDTDVALNCASGLIQPESNSYMLQPDGIGILIPVSRANASMLGTQLGTTEAFTADLVWTDNSNRIAANSNIKMIMAVGSGDTGYVLVMPGSAEGNALVAIKNASDQILWSWHIWVSSYNPYDVNGNPVGVGVGNIWMDRNLGALDNTQGQVNTKGLLYQWGRKDPFSGSTTTNGNVKPTLYNKTGTLMFTEKPLVTNNDLSNAVANPTTFYTNGSGTIAGGQWDDASKSIYDPCPRGWRVPKSSDWVGGTPTFATLGIIYINNAGYLPFAGGIMSNASGFINVGIAGFYWSTDVAITGNAPTTNITPPQNITPTSWGRLNGASVRCISE